MTYIIIALIAVLALITTTGVYVIIKAMNAAPGVVEGERDSSNKLGYDVSVEG